MASTQSEASASSKKRSSRRSSSPHTKQCADDNALLVTKVGRAGDLEKEAVRGWLCSPGTTATSVTATQLLPEVNSELNRSDFKDLGITARTIGGVLANDESGRIKKHKQSGKSSLWTIKRVQDPPGRKSMDKRTAAKLQADSMELKKLEKMEVDTASKRPSPAKKSVQVHETTPRHALHLREALLLTGSLQRKFPQAAFLIVRSCLTELGLDKLRTDEDILRVIPTDYATVMAKVQRIDELATRRWASTPPSALGSCAITCNRFPLSTGKISARCTPSTETSTTFALAPRKADGGVSSALSGTCSRTAWRTRSGRRSSRSSSMRPPTRIAPLTWRLG